MSRWESRCLDWMDRHLTEIVLCLVLVLSFAIRVSNRTFVSKDVQKYLLPWYQEISRGGGLASLRHQTGNYNVLYQTAIALMTYLPMNPLTKYKALSILFDYVLAAGTGVLAVMGTRRPDSASALPVSGRRRGRIGFPLSGPEGRSMTAAVCLCLLTPTVIFNSSLWAQCDAIYTAFIVWSMADLYDGAYGRSLLLLGISFAWKLQAILILPFYLAVWLYRKRFSIFWFLLVPAVMLAASLPAVLMGRPVTEAFLIYAKQTTEFPVMTARFPNIWQLFGGSYDVLHRGAVLGAAAALALLILALGRRRDLLETPEGFLATAALFVWTAVLILPGMHDRYAYLLDILLLVLTVRKPRAFGAFFTVAVSESLLSYSGYLFDQVFDLRLAAAAYLAAYGAFVGLHFLKPACPEESLHCAGGPDVLQ